MTLNFVRSRRYPLKNLIKAADPITRKLYTWKHTEIHIQSPGVVRLLKLTHESEDKNDWSKNMNV